MEAEILRHLNHPQIPRFVEAFTFDNVHYIVQNYINGYPLSYLYSNGQIFTEPEVKHLLQQLLKIITYLHQSTIEKQAIIHRDLRLSNLLIQEDTLSLIDFGLARFVDPKYGSVCLDTPENIKELEIFSLKGQDLRRPGMFTYKLLRKAISPQSDLFGTGVIAIDLLGSQITDEKLFEQSWQTVLPLTTSFGDFLEKLLSQKNNFQSAEAAALALLTLQ